MLDQIWSSTQRLEDLDWFGPEMPYVQCGGGVLALLLSSPCSKFRGEFTSLSSSVLSWSPTSRSPTLSYVGAFPFYSSRWGPLFTYIYRDVLVPPRSPSSSSVAGAHSVGREWRGMGPVGFLGQWVV